LLFFLGARKQKEEVKPHNVPFVLLGAALLWFGWFGFNAGSALQANGLSSVAYVNTQLGASSGFVAWMLLDMMVHKPTSAGAVTGAVIGLVGITPAAGFVQPWASIIIGIVTVFGCYFAVLLKRKLQERGYFSFFDDSLDVFCGHGLGGSIGALLTGLFATKEVNPLGNDGAFYGNGRQFGVQLLAVIVSAGYSVLVTSIIMIILKYTMGIRVSEAKEIEGLDKAVHGEKAYGTIRGTIRGAIDKWSTGSKKPHRNSDENIHMRNFSENENMALKVHREQTDESQQDIVIKSSDTLSQLEPKV